MSKRHPSRTAVRLMPPTTSSASRTVDVTSCFDSWYAALRPAGPAPMMTTSSRPADEAESFTGGSSLPMPPAAPRSSGDGEAEERQHRVREEPGGGEPEGQPLGVGPGGEKRRAQEERQGAGAVALEGIEVVRRQAEDERRRGVRGVRAGQPAEHDDEEPGEHRGPQHVQAGAEPAGVDEVADPVGETRGRKLEPAPQVGAVLDRERSEDVTERD